MIQLYFRDLRRRVERLERHYFRPAPKRVVLHFLDENDVPYLSIYPGAEQPEVRYPPLGPEDYVGDSAGHSAPPQQAHGDSPPAQAAPTSAGLPTAETQESSRADSVDPAQRSSTTNPTVPVQELSTASRTGGGRPSARRSGFFLLAPVATYPGPAPEGPPAAGYRPRNRRPPRRCRHGTLTLRRHS